MVRVLVVEDGFEYSETLERFLKEGFTFERAGSGPVALARLVEADFDVVFLDMRFDRAPEGQLLGDVDDLADRFNGDPVQARRFQEDHQGNFVLAALREAGHAVPVLMSYDFSSEPRRWQRLAERYAPVDFLSDVASPAEVSSRLRALATSAAGADPR
jgi:DNA-binding response OmpR family regulator